MASFLPIPPEKLKEILLKNKIVSEIDWHQMKKNANRRRRGIEDVLIERGFLNERYLYELIGDELKIPYINLRKQKLKPEILEELDEKTIRAAKAIPFALEGRKLKVAFVNPTNKESLEMIKQATKKKIDIYITNYKGFRSASRLYQKNIKEEIKKILETKIPQSPDTPNKMELPIIRIIDAILEAALFERASDIHIEALSDAVVVRFRVDGELHDKVEMPLSVHNAMVARIKILSNLRTDEHRVPQDGRFSFKLDEEEESIRVSVIPAFYGEKVEMRLMTDEAQDFTLGDIGLSEQNIKLMKKQLKKPFGMILVCGPTGSGKTTTLYALINILNTEGTNICTIEDPLEYGINRVNQTQVNIKAGYDFANGLRALLRQDPDIIMVGEIRDKETAAISVRAGLTGHLVLSTLHTNNAAGVPPRLLDMGVEPYLVASTLNVVVAQRLLRKICQDCIQSFKLSANELHVLGKEFNLEQMFHRFKKLKIIEDNSTSFADLTFYHGKGCERCNGSGYKGRVAVMEILENSEVIQNCIIKNSPSNEIEKMAMAQGMINIFEDGMQKSLTGITTIEEVLSIKRE
ncbi:MAG: hypothetical protein COV55_02150 [Candidatus Komeilibacteria bacterium CG11_big_fil_rev_8_21_14_0_20_36_20]|uniref:Bacterial type II secretion system protein E domain-containing protein n=1 Tax=Candidatus Komeilibacteria bacterium CG11_big_fil_rev_8_21_14_0_20_36_20 TaxID=1974477 RepID=A0A2H0NFE4_9BACT|nr:MAG: hypothetical protein COV55_02150 [Candidatus Komeilibacteria bacterium CG11_big_fil_rev_8_21_14_0_20_36_20]PIR81598.1 MAG: hypothetical protein COU21_02960 [Candidatus Komeilibacteria bacterium CG10_big_fil_rev_8_21_14_0_10_36_65]PJC55436.1 MAG: hypothetical protein CO027_02260 [Candidatus Komeilibacteria bacterium CG_4_9_14_0_2_um_filter_36_13]